MEGDEFGGAAGGAESSSSGVDHTGMQVKELIAWGLSIM